MPKEPRNPFEDLPNMQLGGIDIQKNTGKDTGGQTRSSRERVKQTVRDPGETQRKPAPDAGRTQKTRPDGKPEGKRPLFRRKKEKIPADSHQKQNTEPRTHIKRNIRVMLGAFVMAFAVLIVYFVYSTTVYGQRWFANPYNPRIQTGRTNVVAGDVLDRNGSTLATTNSDGERAYAESSTTRKALSHVVGDGYGLASTGVETYMASTLLGFENNIVDRLSQAVSGEKKHGNDVQLTIDKDLQVYASEALGDALGSVVVINYETGEIYAMVSHPEFDPNHMEAYRPNTDAEEKQGKEEGDTGALVNRAVMGRYTPGSVFKMVTAAAALKNIPEGEAWVYDCTGSTTIGGVVVNDYNGEVHGEVDLTDAFAASCNSAFANLGEQIGTSNMQQMAEAFGFNDDFLFSDLILYMSKFETPEDKAALAWASVGQYKTTVSPLHMAMIAGCIANDGAMMQPHLVDKVLDSRGNTVRSGKTAVYKRPITTDQAAILQDMMQQTVESGTGTRAAIKGVDVCGKTGTAEVSNNKDILPHAWFAGFVRDSEYPLAIAVVMEHTGSGGRNAAPVAGKVLNKAMELIF